jgi:hypothetical protein
MSSYHTLENISTLNKGILILGTQSTYDFSQPIYQDFAENLKATI